MQTKAMVRASNTINPNYPSPHQSYLFSPGRPTFFAFIDRQVPSSEGPPHVDRPS